MKGGVNIRSVTDIPRSRVPLPPAGVDNPAGHVTLSDRCCDRLGENLLFFTSERCLAFYRQVGEGRVVGETDGGFGALCHRKIGQSVRVFIRCTGGIFRIRNLKAWWHLQSALCNRALP